MKAADVNANIFLHINNTSINKNDQIERSSCFISINYVIILVFQFINYSNIRGSFKMRLLMELLFPVFFKGILKIENTFNINLTNLFRLKALVTF